MSWMFSNAMMEAYGNSLCSQAQAVESSEVTCSDGEPYAQLNVMPTQHKFWRNDKTMEFSRLSQFGLTCRLLTESHGEAVLTSFLEDFPAKTLAQQVEVRESKVSDQACGNIWQGLLAKYDPKQQSWKTAQCSLLGDLESFSGTWPRWGTMRNGAAYQRRPSVPIMSETESGSLLPTPTCHNAKEGAYPSEYDRNTQTLATHVGGKIHPEFTEWMMGWPIGWTDLKPLETDKFQSWLQQHGAFFAANDPRRADAAA